MSYLRKVIPAIVLFSLASPVLAEDTDAKIKKLEMRITALEERVAKLEAPLGSGSSNPSRAIAGGAMKGLAAWGSLKPGMTTADVQHLLGEPGQEARTSTGGLVWYFPDTKGGSVSFGQDQKVTGWKKP